MELDPAAGRPPAVQWSLSVLDYQAHAVDVWGREHPWGVFIALCGHRLMMDDLQEHPTGGMCPDCSAAAVARRRTGVAPTSGAVPGGCPASPATVRWAHAPGDMRCHGVEPEQVDQTPEYGPAKTLCGQLLPSDNLVTWDAPCSPLCFACVVGVPPPAFPKPDTIR